jgi:hypothetical protein
VGIDPFPVEAKIDVPSEANPPPDCQMPAATLLPVSSTHKDWARVLVEMLAIQPL